MRVVSGILRGRQIKPVPGKSTRPTLDKVKESVFNAMGQFFDGGTCLDLYAGSGNLGIEAISRGVSQCIFVDKDFQAYKIINENIKSLNIEQNSKTYKMDAFKAIDVFSNDGFKFDYVFLDPPYQNQKINDIMILLIDKNLLNDDAIIVAECLKEDELLDNYRDLFKMKEYIYGITKITIFKKESDNNE